jgi:probable HAF family extracellular repeat protein
MSRYTGKAFLAIVAMGMLVLLAGAVSAKGKPQPPPEPGVTYSLVDLGTLGGSRSAASCINNSGQVVGVAHTGPGLTTQHAFLWTAEDGMIDLGVLTSDGSGDSVGNYVNDLGQVVGLSLADPLPDDEEEEPPPTTHAFLWTPQEGMVDLAPDTRDSRAYAINNFGEVVGCVQDEAGQHAVLWEVDFDEDGMVADVTAIDLGLELSPDRGMDINDAGQVVGTSGWLGFLLQPDGTIIWLYPVPGGPDSGANALTSLDSMGGVQVVGWSGLPATDYHPALWKVDAEGNVTVTYLTDKGWSAGAGDINDAGTAVGSGVGHQMLSSTAYIWEGGTTTELSSLVSDSGGFNLTNIPASAINESAQIVGRGEATKGQGWRSGMYHAYIAIPSSTP